MIIDRLALAIDSAPAKGSSRRIWARRELQVVQEALAESRGMNRSALGAAGITWRADIFRSLALAERIDSNGLGLIDAVSHPFTPGRQGWPQVQGSIATVAPTFMAGSLTTFAIVGQPASSLTSMQYGGWIADRLFHRAYARGVYRNVALQLGADEQHWGQSPVGALFISGNASPLPGVTLGTDTAITLPWLFRLAGPVRISAMLADLGESQRPAHAKLAGWQLSMQPWRRFELGVAVLAHTGGGEGVPDASLLERFVDLIPVIDALAPQHADLQISNKLAGGNLRVRFPELSSLDVYYELQIDDFDGRRLRSSLVDDAAHLLGARLPLLVRDGMMVWRAEWHRTSIRLYEHAQYKSGVTYRDRIIGNPLGPHAVGGYLSAQWRWSPLNSVVVALADESRDPSQYRAVSDDARDRGFRFERLTNDPNFRNRRVTASLEHELGGAGGAVRLTFGYNRAWRSGGDGRDEWLGLLSLESRRLSAF